jgi:hypothetical protein
MPKPIDMMSEFVVQRHSVRTGGGWDVIVTPPVMLGYPARTIHLTEDQHERYRKWITSTGMLIQEALPDLSPSMRECLMTGLSDDSFHAAARESE